MAQLLSRLFTLMFSLAVVWVGCDLLFSIRVKGSYFTIFLIYLLGGMSFSSLGMIIAARGISEEFTNGLLNFITWPMMFLSEVWFSLEGTPFWIKVVSNVFPLTHILRAVRGVMNEGAGLWDVKGEVMALSLMTILFLATGGGLFRWNR